jgi:hypothetical protein
MHIALLKALVAITSASVLAVGVALSAPAGGADRPHGSRTVSQTTSLEADGLQFLGQLAAGNVKPDRALTQTWMDDVTAVAHSVPASTPTAVLLRHVREDLDRAGRDGAISPVAGSALLGALSTALGKS